MWITLRGALMCPLQVTDLLASLAVSRVRQLVAIGLVAGIAACEATRRKLTHIRTDRVEHPAESHQEIVMVFRWDSRLIGANQSSKESCWDYLPELLAASADVLGKDLGPSDELDAGSRLERKIQTQTLCRRSDGKVLPVEISTRRISRNRIQCLIRNSGEQAAAELLDRPSTECKRGRNDGGLADLFPLVVDPTVLQPNPRLAKERTDRAIARARHPKGKCALLAVDIDGLNAINLDFEVNCRVLQSVVERMQNCVRDGDSVTRMDGGKFLVVLSGIDNLDSVSHVAARILDSVTVPFKSQNLDLPVTVSIGGAVYPDHGDDFDALHHLADMASRAANKEGGNTFRFCTRPIQHGADQHMLISDGIHEAIARQQFLLHYQPLISLRDGKVVAMEALLRWQHPQLGLVPPGRFIPIAESRGLIVEIGEWVLHEACREAAQWERMGFDIPAVAVNLSAVQFQKGDLVKTVRSALSASCLPPSALEVELTESLLLQESPDVVRTLKGLRELGLSLSLDDFGAGYSGYAYLRNFELDKIKIDRCLISNIATRPKQDAIVKSIICLAKNFGLKTVAEGVEDLATLDAVGRAGCDEVQGYYFAKPMPSADLSNYLRTAVVA
jgi:diguanylate cyclase (GGDEF)-like protein